MKGAGREFMLVLGASVVLYILIANGNGTSTSSVLNALGSNSATLIAALQGRGSGTNGINVPSVGG